MANGTKTYDSQRGTIPRDKGEEIPQGWEFGGRLWWILVPLLAALILAGIALWPHSQINTISNAHLTGLRSPAAVNVLVFADMSGSFTECDQMRREGLQQVLTWAPSNMRADDTFTIISFAADAVPTMSTTTVADMADGGFTLTSAAPDGSDTRITPALTLAASLLKEPASTSIVALTDTNITDSAQTGINSLLSSLQANSMSVITPTGQVIDSGWDDLFYWEEHYQADCTDTQGIAVAVGHALAHATGQQLAPGAAPNTMSTSGTMPAPPSGGSSGSGASPTSTGGFPLSTWWPPNISNVGWVLIWLSIAIAAIVILALLRKLIGSIHYRRRHETASSSDPVDPGSVPPGQGFRPATASVLPGTDHLGSSRQLNGELAGIG